MAVQKRQRGCKRVFRGWLRGSKIDGSGIQGTFARGSTAVPGEKKKKKKKGKDTDRRPSAIGSRDIAKRVQSVPSDPTFEPLGYLGQIAGSL